MLFSSVLAFVASFAGAANAVTPIEIRGRNFVNPKTEERFVMLGITYQPGGQAGYKPDSGVDPLSDGTICLRDAILMQKLGINTIRIYNIDPSLNHDECVSIFNGAGIYMIIDVNSPLSGESLDRSDPSGSYTLSYLERTFAVVEAFKDYPNTLAFFAANEVINDVGTAEPNPPYMRALQRELKNYVEKHCPRPIPVGYSAADVREVLRDTWVYLECAVDGDEVDASRADFFGLNSYSWCGGDATFDTADYDVLVDMFSESTIPIFFSEYGCNEVQPRVFTEVQSIYGPEMTVFSGGLVYEYSQEESDYGIVTINENGTVSLMTDFDNLQAQFNEVDLSQIQSIEPNTETRTPPSCDSVEISDSGFSRDFDIPDPPEGAEEVIEKGIEDPPRGKLVEVTQTKVPMAIYDTEGNEIEGLELRLVASEESNTPGSEELSGTRTAPAPSASTTAGAAKAKFTSGLWGLATLAMLMFWLL